MTLAIVPLNILQFFHLLRKSILNIFSNASLFKMTKQGFGKTKWGTLMGKKIRWREYQKFPITFLNKNFWKN